MQNEENPSAFDSLRSLESCSNLTKIKGCIDEVVFKEAVNIDKDTSASKTIAAIPSEKREQDTQ